jgi:prepilin-type N-terminal cleavage/methylation domain-containing protein
MRCAKHHSLSRAYLQAGFTLIELLVVIVIIAMLVTISVKYLTDARNRAKQTQTAANLSEIHRALESFATDNNGLYPFRMRWFDDATVNAANFDPYSATDTGSGMHSDPAGWFSLGLFGGVKVVTDTFDDNTWTSASTAPYNPNTQWHGMAEHKILQPNYGGDPATSRAFYQVFNQYSDPLVALGYLEAYPPNPFLKRPMGNIMWNYGTTSAGNLDKTIPGPDVVTTPGDFCYTFFYGTSGGTYIDPPGVIEAKKSYVVKTPQETHPGAYYLDLIDSYQMWAYGKLPLNGANYVCYPNNRYGLTAPGLREARRDWDNSGTKDMFEIGLIQYYKVTGTGSSNASNAAGNRVEY